jgi:hypothetical protein
VAVIRTTCAYGFSVRLTEHVARLCRIHNSAHGIVNAAWATSAVRSGTSQGDAGDKLIRVPQRSLWRQIIQLCA